MANYHLVVLIHVLWGNVSHFDYIHSALEEVAEILDADETQLIVHKTTLNEGYKTYDGIDICGFRVAKDISEQIEEFESSGNNNGDKITKFSIVGYSLGGLIARYAVGLLYKSQFFKKREIELLNFTTFCTPHVGVLAPGNNYAVKLFNSIVPLLLGSSGKQMFLKDSVGNNIAKGNSTGTNESLPLIYVMSLQSSIFYKGLSSFKYKSLYANIINDKRTAWWTSGISLNDPFFNINEYNGINVFKYIKGYEEIVVNRNNPIVISKVPEEDNNDENVIKKISVRSKDTDERKQLAGEEFYFLNYWFIKIGKWLMVMLNLLIIAPLFLLWKIIQSCTEMTISAIRVTRFFKRYSHQIMHDYFDISPSPMIESDECTTADSYDTDNDDDFYSLNPTISGSSSIRSVSNMPQEFNNYLGVEGSLNDQADTLMESIYDAIERKRTHAGFLEEAASTSGKISDDSLAVTIRELENISFDQMIAKHGYHYEELIGNIILDLSQTQIDIIKSLNHINWEKYPIYIKDTPSTHACAIVRHNDPKFDEGKIVIKHWVHNVFRRS